ncbi:MAG: aminopeptidase P family protein [Candidatus Aenigmarchaeota archaeon]|nr:aminopeptidase P family protein [Candidatus Aenigmarchaeota archaeon]
MSEFRDRLRRLDALEGRISSVIIFNGGADPNFFYFTNTTAAGVFYYDFTKPRIFTSEMEYRRAKKGWVKSVQIGSAKDVLKKLSGTVGIDRKNIPARTLSAIKAKKSDISPFLEAMRAVKSGYEKACIRKSCRLASEIYEKASSEASGKMTELELKGLIEFLMHKKGATPAFPTIVAAGSNVVFPHHESTTRKISRPLLIDMGVRYKGYCSDITRTTGSRFEGIIEKVFDAVEAELKPGVAAAELDKKARAALGRYSKYFLHSLGHGIGIEVHESPRISSKSNDVLVPGIVFAIEPGLYLRGGIRHEEDYLLGESGAVKLT